MTAIDSTLITTTSVREYFHDTLTAAARNQDVDLGEATTAYVINLLTAYSHATALVPVSDEGQHHKPLALIYAEAIEAGSDEQRNQALQRLGDLALFIAGIFTDSLNRKLVDVDYYIGMGESAYGRLHEALQRRRDRFARVDLFEDLQRKFAPLVDVLGEVSEMSGLKSNADVLRTYEIWMRTGSERAARQLQRSGIVPLADLNPNARH
ncbi:MAG: hypothetical protein H6977_05565 [Gammaproteobacteria bacterium]|nr:hypothetical protein [Gammaproteobacteria bacterium]MCP5199457.1 hypothetical protein [Gammaproteobacteria bacterium]